MKKFIQLIPILLFVVFWGCEEEEVSNITVEDFTAQIKENPNNGDLIGVINASTNKGSLKFSIDEEIPSGGLSINSTTGELIVLDSSIFDFEQNKTIQALIHVDNGEVSEYAIVNITIIDIQPSIVVEDFNISIDENPTMGQVLGTIQCETIESSEKEFFMYSSGFYYDALAVDRFSGELIIANPVIFDYEKRKLITAEVMVRSDFLYEKGLITITLNDVLD